jgi:hypothetical protein
MLDAALFEQLHFEEKLVIGGWGEGDGIGEVAV